MRHWSDAASRGVGPRGLRPGHDRCRAAPPPSRPPRPALRRRWPARRCARSPIRQLDELSGMVATEDGFVVINDGTDVDSHKRVFFLDANCKIARGALTAARPARHRGPDPLAGRQDAVDRRHRRQRPERTRPPHRRALDDAGRRPKKPEIHRLTLPRGRQHDAEALLLNGDGTPIIVTKEVGRPAGCTRRPPPSRPTTPGRAAEEGRRGHRPAERHQRQHPLPPAAAARSTGGAVAPAAARWRCGPTPTRSSGTSPAATCWPP